MGGLDDLTAPKRCLGLLFSGEGWSFAPTRDPIRMHGLIAVLADGASCEMTQLRGQELALRVSPTLKPVLNSLIGVLSRGDRWGIAASE
jgi:hypothetical protein